MKTTQKFLEIVGFLDIYGAKTPFDLPQDLKSSLMPIRDKEQKGKVVEFSRHNLSYVIPDAQDNLLQVVVSDEDKYDPSKDPHSIVGKDYFVEKRKLV